MICVFCAVLLELHGIHSVNSNPCYPGKQNISEKYDDGTQGLVFLRSLAITHPRLFQNKSSVSDTFDFNEGCNLKLRSIHVQFDGTCDISVTSKGFDKSGMQKWIKLQSDTAVSCDVFKPCSAGKYSLADDVHSRSTVRFEVTVNVSSGAKCGLSYYKSGQQYVWSGAQLYTTGKSSLQSRPV